MNTHVLPESGRVLGIDVGYSVARPTTAFCALSWTQDHVDWSGFSATAQFRSRREALLRFHDNDQASFLAVAIDGPLRPNLRQQTAYRTAELLLSRGAFQKRGKPGPTNAGSGPQLHKHATLLAKMFLRNCTVETATMPFSASNVAVYEAFPTLFLGVLCAERDYPIRPAKRRCWTDSLFPLVASRLDELLHNLLPRRRSRSVAATYGHEPVAALTCALTALAAAAGRSTAVGSPSDGFIVLPPLSLWGKSVQGSRWAERELRSNLYRLPRDQKAVCAPQIFEGADRLDWNRE
jgi:hypothetical protein